MLSVKNIEDAGRNTNVRMNFHHVVQQLETTTINDIDETSTQSGSDVEETDTASHHPPPPPAPSMLPIKPHAKVFSSRSTAGSISLATDVKLAADNTTKIHGISTTGTPWLFARRLKALKTQNRTFLAWCRAWIKEIYGTEASLITAPKTEPHIVKYDHAKVQRSKKKKKKNGKHTFDGIGIHQDGSFVTIILSLSSKQDYEGGGTYFPHLGQTVRLGLGEILMFQGEQGTYSSPHRAQPISSGKRSLCLVFFKLKSWKKKKGGVKRKKRKKTTKKNKEVTGKEKDRAKPLTTKGNLSKSKKK